MRMYLLPNGKYVNPQLVTCCYVSQIDKNIYQSVFEFNNEYKVLCSHGTFEEANKDVLNFASFCDES